MTSRTDRDEQVWLPLRDFLGSFLDDVVNIIVRHPDVLDFDFGHGGRERQESALSMFVAVQARREAIRRVRI